MLEPNFQNLSVAYINKFGYSLPFGFSYWSGVLKNSMSRHRKTFSANNPTMHWTTIYRWENNMNAGDFCHVGILLLSSFVFGFTEPHGSQFIVNLMLDDLFLPVVLLWCFCTALHGDNLSVELLPAMDAFWKYEYMKHMQILIIQMSMFFIINLLNEHY